MRVLRVVVALAFSLIFFGGNVSAGYMNDPSWTIPESCLNEDYIVKFLQKIEDPQSGIYSYHCVYNNEDGKTTTFETGGVVAEGTLYKVDISYIRYAISLIEFAYKGGALPLEVIRSGQMTIPNDVSVCSLQTDKATLGFKGGRLLNDGTDRYFATHKFISGISTYPFGVIQEGDTIYENGDIAINASKSLLREVATARGAYGYYPCWFKIGFNEHVRYAFNNGYREVDANNQPITGEPDPDPDPDPDPPPGTGTGATTPPCTKPDGTSSGNPYDCAPTNEETKCGIIDIPCNSKKLLIPDKDFVTNKIKNSDFGVNVNLPISVVHEWTEIVTIGPWSIPIGLSFRALEISEKGRDQWRFMIFWGTFLWLLHFLGVPFLGTRQQVGTAGRDAGMVSAAQLDGAGKMMADGINKGGKNDN